MQLIAAHKSAPALGYSNASASAHHSALQLCTDTNGSPAACQQLPVSVVKLHENSCKDRAPEALHVPRINPKELTILLHCSTPPAPALDKPCANPCSLGLAVESCIGWLRGHTAPSTATGSPRGKVGVRSETTPCHTGENAVQSCCAPLLRVQGTKNTLYLKLPNSHTIRRTKAEIHLERKAPAGTAGSLQAQKWWPVELWGRRQIHR